MRRRRRRRRRKRQASSRRQQNLRKNHHQRHHQQHFPKVHAWVVGPPRPKKVRPMSPKARARKPKGGATGAGGGASTGGGGGNGGSKLDGKDSPLDIAILLQERCMGDASGLHNVAFRLGTIEDVDLVQKLIEQLEKDEQQMKQWHVALKKKTGKGLMNPSDYMDIQTAIAAERPNMYRRIHIARGHISGDAKPVADKAEIEAPKAKGTGGVRMTKRCAGHMCRVHKKCVQKIGLR